MVLKMAVLHLVGFVPEQRRIRKPLPSIAT